MNWFKLHTEARNDAKLRSLSDSQHRVWFSLLCFAAEQEKRGTISDWQDDLLAVEVANGDVGLLKETLQVLVRLRIIVCDGKAIIFINFDKRQYSKPSDNREQMRLRKQRQREKDKGHAVSRPCHAGHSVTKRDVRDMSQKGGPQDLVFAVAGDEKCGNSEKMNAGKPLAIPIDRNGHADVTPMSRPVTRCHATDTDTDLINKHIDIEDTSISILSASPVRGESENASPIPTPSAPDGAVPAQGPLSDGKTPTTPPIYLTKRGRKLAGWKLEAFDEFWKTFAYKKGRAEAADAWLNIPNLSNDLASRIIEAAGKEAKARPALISKGQTPKWAQGWLSGRRWEDWEEGTATTDNNCKGNQEVNHDTKGYRSSRQDRAEYLESLREAVKRFM